MQPSNQPSKSSWGWGETIGLGSLVIAVFAVVIALITPEIRCHFGLDICSTDVSEDIPKPELPAETEPVIEPAPQPVVIVTPESVSELEPRSPETLEDFEDGDYLYGEINGAPNIPYNNYVFFRKEGTHVTGIYYALQAGSPTCFNGTVNLNSLQNVTFADREPPATWEYATLSKFNLLENFPYPIKGEPYSEVTSVFEICLDLLMSSNSTKPW